MNSFFQNVKFVKNLEETYDLQGSLKFFSEVYQKQYDTNKYDQFLNNTLHSILLRTMKKWLGKKS